MLNLLALFTAKTNIFHAKLTSMYRQLRLPTYTTFITIIGAALLVATASQYPLATTFPAGGDAAVHIRHARGISSLTAMSAF